ncbi:MAG: kinase [Alphaproteobacteria bacterium]|nr:kinase [Alphaproteobacteria bacterium]
MIIVLGGDGFMLKTLHQFQTLQKPVYGINCGTVGFLMNAYQESDLLNRLEGAKETVLHPLKMTAMDKGGKRTTAHAINEVSFLRQTAQAAKIRIYVGRTCVRWGFDCHPGGEYGLQPVSPWPYHSHNGESFGVNTHQRVSSPPVAGSPPAR